MSSTPLKTLDGKVALVTGASSASAAPRLSNWPGRAQKSSPARETPKRSKAWSRRFGTAASKRQS